MGASVSADVGTPSPVSSDSQNSGVYTLSLLVWVGLVADTVGLAQRAATPPVFPTSAPVVQSGR